MGVFNINGIGDNHLSMKVVCFVLFCFVLWLWDPPNWDASDCVLGLWKALKEGCMGLVP